MELYLFQTFCDMLSQTGSKNDIFFHLLTCVPS